MGHSMGALGTWRIAAKYPNLWAAIGTTSEAANLTQQQMHRIPQIVVHGDADLTVPVSGSRTMVEALKKLSGDVLYIEVPGGSHADVVAPICRESSSSSARGPGNPGTEKLVCQKTNPTGNEFQRTSARSTVFVRRRDVPTGANREPFGPKVYPCPRNGPPKGRLLGLDSNQQPSGQQQPPKTVITSDQMRLYGTRSDHKRSQEIGRYGFRNSSGNSSELDGPRAFAVPQVGPSQHCRGPLLRRGPLTP